MALRLRLLLLPTLLLLTLSACQFNTVLDDTFDLTTYERDYVKLQGVDGVNLYDLFLLNYAILRQRDYYNYQIEGKTYGEILEMARSFQKIGMPVKETYNRNGEQDLLILDPAAEGMGMVRKGKSSRLKKVLNFSCSFENPTDQDLVIASATFLLKGPFNDHLSTVSYELNCIVNQGQKIDILFVADATNITRNLLYNRPFKAPYIDIDNLLNNMEVEVGGATVEQQTANFEDCMHYNARIEPHKAMDYQEAFAEKEWLEKDANGHVSALKLGDTHFEIEYSDEPVNINEFLK